MMDYFAFASIYWLLLTKTVEIRHLNVGPWPMRCQLVGKYNVDSAPNIYHGNSVTLKPDDVTKVHILHYKT